MADQMHRGVPRRWFLLPFVLGVILMLLAVLFWIFPRLLLFIFLFPVFMTGLGLALYGLDLWRGVPNWRKKVERVTVHVWPKR